MGSPEKPQRLCVSLDFDWLSPTCDPLVPYSISLRKSSRNWSQRVPVPPHLGARLILYLLYLILAPLVVSIARGLYHLIRYWLGGDPR